MTKQTLDVLGLSPNQNYIIKVFATKTDPTTGNVTVSNYSPTLQISTPSLSGSGANFTTTNYGTDIQLSGGSLFAGTFPSNIGQVDLTTTNPNGTGVIVNQTGVGAYSGGVQEFFLNAKTGAATFAGTITTPTIQSANYSPSLATVEPKFSVAGTQISLTDGSISSPKFRITPSGSGYFGGDVSGSFFSGVSLSSYISSTATSIAAASASGKNTIHYGAGTGANSGTAPNGVSYTITSSSDGFLAGEVSGVMTGASNIVGDTWFVYNSSNHIIAQYGGLGGTSWQRQKVEGLTIANIDAGSITTGTLSAITISGNSITGGTITGTTITGSQFNTTSGTTSNIIIANTSATWYDSGGALSQITSSSGSAANGLHFFVPGGVEALAIYGSGSAGSPNTNIMNQPLQIFVNGDTSTGGRASVRNIVYDNSGLSYTGVPSTTYYGTLLVQYV
jgi:hypothetical protein